MTAETEQTDSKKPWSFSDWYYANRDAISSRRKYRYDNDPEYRQKVLDLNKRSRQKRLDAQAIQRGNLPKLFHAAELAKEVGRNVSTVKVWQKTGLIPESPFVVGKRKEKMYTQEMIGVVKSVVKQTKYVAKGNTLIRDQIAAGWQALGLKVDV